MSYDVVKTELDGAVTYTDERGWFTLDSSLRVSYAVLAAEARAAGLTLAMSYNPHSPEADRTLWITDKWESCIVSCYSAPAYHRVTKQHVDSRALHDYVDRNRKTLAQLADNDEPTRQWAALLDDLGVEGINCVDSKRELEWYYRRRQGASDEIPRWVNKHDVVNGVDGIPTSELARMWPDGYRVTKRFTPGFGPAHVCTALMVACSHYTR